MISVLFSTFTLVESSAADCRSIAAKTGEWVSVASSPVSQTVSESYGVRSSHSAGTDQEWSRSAEASVDRGFKVFGRKGNFGVKGSASHKFSQTQSSSFETEWKLTLTETFPPGTVWQFQMFVDDGCGRNTVMTPNFQFTQGEPPCCLPNQFLKIGEPLGYCRAADDGYVHDLCRSDECPTCNGNGKPSQSWQPGQPCTCVCDEFYTGATCADLHIDGTYRIWTEVDHQMWHADECGNHAIETRYQQDSSWTAFHIHRENGHDTYTIRSAYDNLVLHTNSLGDKMVTTKFQQDSGYTRYHFEHRQDHGAFTIRVEATNENLHADNCGDKMISVRHQEDSGWTRFLLQKLSDQDLMV